MWRSSAWRKTGKYSTLTEDPHPAMFLPLLQWPSNTAWMVVRSSRDPQLLGADIRRVLHTVDAGLPVEIEKRHDEMVTSLFGPKMATIALGVLGVMGAMLSITGIFGLAAYTVSKRLRELGIRVALGAKEGPSSEGGLGEGLSNCSPLVRPQDWCWDFWPHACWLSLCIRPHRAIRLSCWVSLWRCSW